MERPKELEKWYVGRTDLTGPKWIFDSEKEADQKIVELHVIDPDGVEKGDYYLDAPPDDW